MILATADPAADALPWLGTVGILLLAATAAALWLIVARLKRMEARLERLDRLTEIKATIDRLLEKEDGLDLRRLEHVLIDIRDGQKRVEDRLLAVVESARGPLGDRGGGPAASGLPVGAASALAERVVNRLLALGYDRVQIVTSMEEIGKLADGDGDVLVEARRDGAPCKGRVSVRKGALADIQIQSAYSAFP